VFLINTHALKPRVMVQVLEVKPSDTGLGGRAHLVEEGITSFQHGQSDVSLCLLPTRPMTHLK